MRIITGNARGVKLKTPRGLNTRPTADRVKESVCNILRNRFVDAQVLDLFAGTGNLGLEALSRGAKHCVFVDASTAALIRENAVHTKLANQTEVLRTDVYKALKQFAAAGRSFDLIFCDPPYELNHCAAVLTMLDKSALLAPGGVFVLEHSCHEEVTNSWESLEVVRSERYGETIVSFIQNRNS